MAIYRIMFDRCEITLLKVALSQLRSTGTQNEMEIRALLSRLIVVETMQKPEAERVAV